MKEEGLTQKEVLKRIEKGQVNQSSFKKTKTIKEIILSNIFTYFNILNIFLGLSIILTGLFTGNFFNSFKNCLFLGVIVANTVISIYQELSAKKILDKMNLVVNQKVLVKRDGEFKNILIEEIVLDDVIELNIGNQIVVDGIFLSG